MLSIIICSRSRSLSEALTGNIRETIGCHHELLKVDNSVNNSSIYKVYNRGLKDSTFPYVIFVHEDMLFHTQDWGNIIIQLFRANPGYGLFGIAGANIKTNIPSGWWDCPQENKYLNLIQHFPNGSIRQENMGFKFPGVKEAVVVDGVFLALRKDIGVNFSEDFSGFHGYDLNIGFEVLKKGFKIGVTDSILIEHFSYGHQNTDWLESMVKVHYRYRKLLPLSTDGSSVKKQEIINCRKFMMKCLETGKKKWFYYYWLNLIFLNPVSRFHYELAKRILA